MQSSWKLCLNYTIWNTLDLDLNLCMSAMTKKYTLAYAVRPETMLDARLQPEI